MPTQDKSEYSMENVVEFFYEKLKNSTTPGVILAQFYADILERTSGRSEIIMFNKLVKLFGRFSVFFAVMNLVNVTNLDNAFPYGLIFKICRDNIEKKSAMEYDAPSSRNLNRDVDKMEEAIEKTKAAKVDDKMYEGLE